MRRPDGAEPLKRVRAARREQTPAERLLWSHLRSRQLGGWKFRRQVWVGRFIADFLCAEAKLIVEVDGDTHAVQVNYDESRTAWLRSEGFRVVRFSNFDVMENVEGVLHRLLADLPSPSQPAAPAGPLPLPFRERGMEIE
jgi:very-short-patch-repair endonuclease